MPLDDTRDPTDALQGLPEQSYSRFFSEFLTTNTFLEYRFSFEALRQPQPTCLLDIVGLWVTIGKATEECPDYEAYLLAVIDIVYRAMQFSRDKPYFDDVAYWPLEDWRPSGDLEVEAVALPIWDRRGESSRPSNVLGTETIMHAACHPAVSKRFFLEAKAHSEAAKQDQHVAQDHESGTAEPSQ